MVQYDLFGTVEKLLIDIDQLSVSIREYTDQITEHLKSYDLEKSDPEDLVGIILSREKLVLELQEQQAKLKPVLNELAYQKINSDIVEKLKNKISQRLDEILIIDQNNAKQINTLQLTLSSQFATVKKGRKFTKAYNVFPHRKSLFLDVAN